MAREKGTFNVSANYEPLKAAPFDARSLVKTKSDLTNSATWDTGGDNWIYDGMIVAVAHDSVDKNNGVYRLIDAENYNFEGSWLKLAESYDIEELQKRIDDLDSSADIDLETEAELPEVGDENATYFIKETSSIKRWDAESGAYVAYGASTLDINIINGGNANE